MDATATTIRQRRKEKECSGLAVARPTCEDSGEDARKRKRCERLLDSTEELRKNHCESVKKC